MALLKAYRVTGNKNLFEEKAIEETNQDLKIKYTAIYNILYLEDENFRTLRWAKLYAQNKTKDLNERFGLNFTIEDYFGDLKEATKAGYIYDTENDEYRWLEPEDRN